MAGFGRNCRSKLDRLTATWSELVIAALAGPVSAGPAWLCINSQTAIDASPIWNFLARLNANEIPEDARTAATGLHLIEVFPALALASLEPRFFARLAAPRYNPARRTTFRIGDWRDVAGVAARHFRAFGAGDAAAWCAAEEIRVLPTKADQDRLDAMLCLLVAMHWRHAPRDRSMMVGTLDAGYMVFPASVAVRDRIAAVAAKRGIPAG
jgi:predicted RNase H-like nuclease